MVIKLYFYLSAKLFLQFLKVNLGNYQQRDTLGTDFVRLCCFYQKIIDAKSLVLTCGIFGLYFMLFKAELYLLHEYNFYAIILPPRLIVTLIICK